MPAYEHAEEHVDAVVIGSGFGGSVAAFRLAEAGRSVVLLERGRDHPPGSFPRSPAQMSRAFWDPAEGLYGMYDVWSFRGLDSVVSSGLGGGSLTYANVLLRKDEHWFERERKLPDGGYERWPITRADLEPHYDEVERMLGAVPYPFDRPAYADTPKTRAMQDAAVELGLGWNLVPLAVSFAPEQGAEPAIGVPITQPAYGNLHGLPRRTCRLCGECDIGCNDGAKNSLDHTYLSAARHHGADLRTLHEARAIRPRPGGGYEVDYVRHDPASGSRRPPVRTIGCDHLVLAAGTYGTSYLLLRSRKNLPGLSGALGTRFCGNGDLVTFLLKATDHDRVRPLNASRGPAITSAIRLPDERDGGAGHGAYIEDGGYPAFVDWLVAGADVTGEVARIARFLFERFGEFIRNARDTNQSKEISDLIGDGALSVSSLPLLGMGRDVPDGVLRLRDGRLDVDWNIAASRAHFERLRKTMRRIADVLGAQYVDNPAWLRRRVITVHPLGGAPMGRHPGEGVCDPYGEVFGLPGLYIADGAALPGPVGTNPALTIAALADRMATRLLERMDTTAGTSMATDAMAGTVAAAKATSLSFTEEMKGLYGVGTGDPDAVNAGTGQLAAQPESFAFRLTITVDDVDGFLTDPEHAARAEGWIDAVSCGGRRPVQRGWFNLFAPTDATDRRLMKYRLYFSDGMDRPRTLIGWKTVRHGPPTRIWSDTSTLFFRVLEGHVPEDEQASVVGAGTLHIELPDFVEQLASFRPKGPHGIRALKRFGTFFAGELWDVYGPDGPACTGESS